MKSALCVVASFSLLVAGCNPFAPDQTTQLGVSKLDAPGTVAANGTLEVTLTVETGGCLSFERIEVNRYAGGASLTVWGKDASIGRKDVTCPDILIEEPHTVRFDPPFSGTFNITVNRGRLGPLMATVQVQ